MPYTSILQRHVSHPRRTPKATNGPLWAVVRPKADRTELEIQINAELLRRLGWQVGERVDILVDESDHTGLIRKDPTGLTLSRRGPSTSKHQHTHVRLRRCNWEVPVDHRTVPLTALDTQQGELLFEIPMWVLFNHNPQGSVGRPLIEVLAPDGTAPEWQRPQSVSESAAAASIEMRGTL